MEQRGDPSGFTLTLDGEPDAIQRILRAVYREMAELRAWPPRDILTASGPRPYLPALPVKGQIQLRWPI